MHQYRASVITLGISTLLLATGLHWFRQGVAGTKSASPQPVADAPAPDLREPPAQGTTSARAPRLGPPKRYDRGGALTPAHARQFPESIEAARLTDGQREKLAELNAQQLSMLDYKLGVLSRLRQCFSERGVEQRQGTVTVFLHYQLGEDGSQAHGSEVDLLDSSIPSEADSAVYACLQTAHVGSAMAWRDAPPARGEFHWATDFALPLEDDGAYAYFAN